MFIELIPHRAVVREPHDWHPHNPNAEREAQARFEGTGDWEVEF
jgi:hypothetical protein